MLDLIRVGIRYLYVHRCACIQCIRVSVDLLIVYRDGESIARHTVILYRQGDGNRISRLYLRFVKRHCRIECEVGAGEVCKHDHIGLAGLPVGQRLALDKRLICHVAQHCKAAVIVACGRRIRDLLFQMRNGECVAPLFAIIIAAVELYMFADRLAPHDITLSVFVVGYIIIV